MQREREAVDPEPQPDELYERKELADAVRQALFKLESRDRQIIARIYGLDGAQISSRKEIAAEFALSISRIQEIERRALTLLIDKSPALKQTIAFFKGRKRRLIIGGFKIGDRVMAWDSFTSSPIGFGTIVDFKSIFFNQPKLCPQIEMDNGALLCSSRFMLIDEKRALRSSERLWSDLFGGKK